MSRIWFKSLYWRIAIGFVALLAAVLVAQGLLFVWLTYRIDQSPAGRTPQQLADYVARQISMAMSDNPSLDLPLYISREFSGISRPFVVVMADGRRISNRPEGLPEGFPGPPPRGRSGRSGGPGRGGGDRPDPTPGAEPPPATPSPGGQPGGPPPEFRGGGPGFGRRGGPNSAPIVANGRQVGIVAVPQSSAAILALREFGPALAGAGLLLLLGGATAAALLIFGPIHKRIRSLEVAARALGEGHADVRANESGGDEVAALARTFNRMAADLEARNAALAASDRARRQLLADVSHELMTPLTAIRGYVQTLSMHDIALDDPTRTRYLSIADQETYKLEAIIGDLLDLAKLEGGGEKTVQEPVTVAELFRRVIDRHLPDIRSKDVTTQIQIADGTPRLLGNPGRLEQALQNLAANAIRHMPDGGTLTLAARSGDGQVVVSVRDTGPGIPLEHLPHIFDRFYKADYSRAGSTIRSGSGLGLSIVQAIARHHGGEVEAANAEGGGAIFTLRLPAEPPPAAIRLQQA
jgi:signal transduction histidine kinase